jgi:hypothetical protein
MWAGETFVQFLLTGSHPCASPAALNANFAGDDFHFVRPGLNYHF